MSRLVLALVALLVSASAWGQGTPITPPPCTSNCTLTGTTTLTGPVGGTIGINGTIRRSSVMFPENSLENGQIQEPTRLPADTKCNLTPVGDACEHLFYTIYNTGTESIAYAEVIAGTDTIYRATTALVSNGRSSWVFENAGVVTGSISGTNLTVTGNTVSLSGYVVGNLLTVTTIGGTGLLPNSVTITGAGIPAGSATKIVSQVTSAAAANARGGLGSYLLSTDKLTVGSAATPVALTATTQVTNGMFVAGASAGTQIVSGQAANSGGPGVYVVNNSQTATLTNALLDAFYALVPASTPTPWGAINLEVAQYPYGPYTSLAAPFVSRGAGGSWNSDVIANTGGVLDGGVLKLLVEGGNSGANGGIGAYTSNDMATVAPNLANPVMPNSTTSAIGGPSAPAYVNSGALAGQWCVLVHATTQGPGVYDQYRACASSLTSAAWTVSTSPALLHHGYYEGAGVAFGVTQGIPDPYLLPQPDGKMRLDYTGEGGPSYVILSAFVDMTQSDFFNSATGGDAGSYAIAPQAPLTTNAYQEVYGCQPGSLPFSGAIFDGCSGSIRLFGQGPTSSTYGTFDIYLQNGIGGGQRHIMSSDQFGNFATQGGLTATGPVVMGGTKFTISGCSATATSGKGNAGIYTSGTTGTCTVVITINGGTGGVFAPTAWNCMAADWTTPANAQTQTAATQSTVTLTGTTTSGDQVHFWCGPY